MRCALVAAVQVTCVTIPNPERSIENAPSETKAIEFVRVLRMRRMEEKLSQRNFPCYPPTELEQSQRDEGICDVIVPVRTRFTCSPNKA